MRRLRRSRRTLLGVGGEGSGALELHVLRPGPARTALAIAAAGGLARELRVPVGGAPEGAGSAEPPLRCPQCEKKMVPLLANGVTLDRCKRCKQLWLDGGELESLSGPDALAEVERGEAVEQT